ncbi:alpha-L-fucosidase [Prolixibacteraceae bacterium]|nr:alpha-L-fucosidase [Prolixibacteraceae bacterium]
MNNFIHSARKRFSLTMLFAGAILISSSCLATNPKTEGKDDFKENWEVFKEHKASPKWFADAKLGIYFHWGVYSVPAFANEWYPRNMHFDGHWVNKHHTEKYGPVNEFGYHDFVPMFKAEHFNAKEWVQLFKDAGAKFAGPVAEHHDGFSMWDSEITPWNSMDKGPHKDIVGEMKKELDKQGMKLITTFHHSRNLQRYRDTYKEEMAKTRGKFNHSHYPFYPGTPPTSDDQELKYLYGNMPEAEWNEKVWFGKLKEVIDTYQPDIIWFDSWLDQIPEDYRKKFCAYYLEEAKKWNKDVVIVRKQNDLPIGFTVDDLEKSRKNKIEKNVWMTDETISKGSWCYTDKLTIKPTEDVIHVLIDIVSKNGVLLLNVSPKADGSIPQDQRTVLKEMGAWLKKYGESIYETRPWYTFGEGPTKEPEGDFKNHKKFLKIKYTAEDIRYTTKENTVYASVLGKVTPERDYVLKAFDKAHKDHFGKVKGVAVLGSDQKIKWKLKKDGLHITMPSDIVDKDASVIKIQTQHI